MSINLKCGGYREESGIVLPDGFYIPYSILRCAHEIKGAKGVSGYFDFTGEGTKFVKELKEGKYDEKKPSYIEKDYPVQYSDEVEKYRRWIIDQLWEKIDEFLDLSPIDHYPVSMFKTEHLEKLYKKLYKLKAKQQYSAGV